MYGVVESGMWILLRASIFQEFLLKFITQFSIIDVFIINDFRHSRESGNPVPFFHFSNSILDNTALFSMSLLFH
jgi:hypothetical protein